MRSYIMNVGPFRFGVWLDSDFQVSLGLSLNPRALWFSVPFLEMEILWR